MTGAEGAREATPPGPEAAAASPDPVPGAEEAGAELDDAQGGVDDVQSIVVDSVQSHAAFIGTSMNVGGDLVIGGRERFVVATVDLTASVEALIAEDAFVAPAFLPELAAAVGAERLAVIRGRNCGGQTAAAVALRRAGHDPILQLPSDLEASELVEAVERTRQRRPRAGLLVDGIDGSTLGQLDGFELPRLRAALGDQAGLVLTAGEGAAASVPGDVPLVDGATPPDAGAIIAARARAQGVPQERAAAAIRALGLLAAPVAPRVAVRLFHAANDDPDAGPEALAARFASEVTDELLNTWVRPDRSAREVAKLTAAAVLEGATLTDVDAMASDLERRLLGDGPSAAAGEPVRFGLEERGWPEGVLEVRRERLSVGRGRAEADVVRICPPHDRERVVAWLWRSFRGEFRARFLAWLHDAASHPSGRVRAGVAITAGLLLVREPLEAQRQLLRPWADDGRGIERSCAALALGAPVALGADPTESRSLVRDWGAQRDERRRRVAVLAYGGLLGAWDTGSAAASHLWRIGEQTPSLRALTNAALASLTAAGAEAVYARATVLGVLTAEIEDRSSRDRVYDVVPLIARALTRGHPSARASLKALQDEDENRRAYAALLARAFEGRETGMAAGRRTLTILIDAGRSGRIDEAAVERLVDEMGVAARRRGRDEVLALRLNRALIAERRERRRGSGVEERLIALLFDSLRRLTEHER